MASYDAFCTDLLGSVSNFFASAIPLLLVSRIHAMVLLTISFQHDISQYYGNASLMGLWHVYGGLKAFDAFELTA